MNNLHFTCYANKVAATTFIILFIAVFSAFSQTTKPDFTGTWNLNTGKSELGDGPGRRAASKMIITQDENSLTNEKTMTRQSGETVVTKEKYNLDGTESDNSTDNRKKKSTAKWSNTMGDLQINSTTTFERDGNTMEMKSAEIYKLSDDKQTLTIENTFSSARGDFKTKLVYDLAKQ